MNPEDADPVEVPGVGPTSRDGPSALNAEDANPLDDTLLSLAASCDEALADGRAPDLPQTALVPEEHRSDLEGRIDCMRLLRAWAGDSGATPGGARPSLAPTATGTEPSLSPRGTPATHIGRFEVRRELGRGGFGVVFLAHDPLLGRDVALKVPRTEAFLDPQLRARLHREATIAAGLDHPHIVPIYEAGEAGPVCYIASAYCPGVTLAAWLKEQRAPVPFRDAATLAATLAEAVHYAHSRGVVHRDLKPANVLLQRGNRRSPGEETNASPSSQSEISNLQSAVAKITDFGLAKLLDDTNSVTQALTHAGAIVGTPEYMAPEQAGTAAGPVGPATDVYALGVILYEMLAGRPPFQGDSTLEILRQVETAEPLPPGRLRPKLPRDLETICLKCLQKESRRRYPGADALAVDLRRFLAGEPVRARPVGTGERVVRWCRRKPVVAGLVSALVLVVLAGLAGILWQWQRATDSAAKAERNAAAFKEERDIAQRRLHILRDRVDALTKRGRDLLGQPGQYAAGKALLEEALPFYDALLPEDARDPQLRRQAIGTYHQVAAICHLLGQWDRALEAYGHAATLLSALVEEEPANKGYLHSLANNHRYRGNVLRDLGQMAEARAAYDQAARIHDQLYRESPADMDAAVDLANTLLNKAAVLSTAEQAKELEETYVRAVELDRAAVQARPGEPWYESELALCLEGQANILLADGRHAQALPGAREAVAIRQKLFDSGRRKSVDDQRYLARSYANLGHVLAVTGAAREAEQAYRKALARLEPLVKDSPSFLFHRRELVRSYLGLVGLLGELGRQTEAAELYRKALAVAPEDPGVNNDLAWFLATRAEPRLRDAPLAVRLATKAVAAGPKSADYTNTLGVAQYRNGNARAAVATLEKATRLRAGGDASDWFFLAMAHWSLGDHDQARTCFDQAVQWMAGHKPHDVELRRFRAEAEGLLAEPMPE